jgi:hypothetical protein
MLSANKTCFLHHLRQGGSAWAVGIGVMLLAAFASASVPEPGFGRFMDVNSGERVPSLGFALAARLPSTTSGPRRHRLAFAAVIRAPVI